MPGGVRGQGGLHLEEATKKLVKDMHYEARVQAIIDYYAQHRGMKVKKEEARTMNLTREQFLKVI